MFSLLLKYLISVFYLRLHARKSSLSPHKFISDHSKAVLLLWFNINVIVRPLSVCLRPGVVYAIYCPLGFLRVLLYTWWRPWCLRSFPLSALDRMWNLIVSVHDHCCFMYSGKSRRVLYLFSDHGAFQRKTKFGRHLSSYVKLFRFQQRKKKT